MANEYLIKETKPATYTYRVYANSEKEALAKYKAGDCSEDGLSFDGTHSGLTVSYNGEAKDNCSICGLVYSPNKLSQYLCEECSD